MTETDYSQVVSVFLVAYAVMYAFSGYIVDRLGTRRGFSVFIFVWSCAAMLHGFATGKWSLAGCRALLGLGEPGNWPAAARAVAEWFPARMRALGIGIFNAGTMLGSAARRPIVGFLTLNYGWRLAFYFTGALGFLWLAGVADSLPASAPEPLAARFRIRGNEARSADPGAGHAGHRGAVKLVGSDEDPRVLHADAGAVLHRPGDLLRDLLAARIPAQRAALRSGDGGPIRVPAVYCRGRGLPRGRMAFGQADARRLAAAEGAQSGDAAGRAIMPVAILAPRAPTAALAIAAICFVTMGHAFWISNLLALPTDICRAGEIGTVMGISGMGGTLGGILANFGTAWVVQHFTYAPVFAMAGLMHPLGVGIVCWLLPNWRFGERNGLRY